MGLWHVLAACAAAWVSGALFGLGILDWLVKNKPVTGETVLAPHRASKVPELEGPTEGPRKVWASRPKKLLASPSRGRLYRDMVRDAGHWLQLWSAVLLVVAAFWAVAVVTIAK